MSGGCVGVGQAERLTLPLVVVVVDGKELDGRGVTSSNTDPLNTEENWGHKKRLFFFHVSISRFKSKFHD